MRNRLAKTNRVRMIHIMNSLMIWIAVFAALMCGFYIYALGYDWAHQNHGGIVVLFAVGLVIGLFVLLAQRLPLPIPHEVYDPHDYPFARRSIGCAVVGACVCLLGLAYMATVGWIWQTWVAVVAFLVLYSLALFMVGGEPAECRCRTLLLSYRVPYIHIVQTGRPRLSCTQLY